ncbi:MAG: argininosuccinate synthase [Chloroflexi bacterium]|nr:argininosuccinate synthase [Chloroflexota bacterium]
MANVVLAYSGGLDTSVAIKWIRERYGLDVITLTVDVGNQPKLEQIREKALRTGAAKAFVVDARDDFVNYFVWPSLQAGAIYEGCYPLATALARPLISKLLVDVARSEGATAVAHGCTGKGNDQVRFDVSVGALAPDLQIIAPLREWNMTREDEIRYAQKHDIPVPVTIASPYSVDENLWGRSIEAGALEDPWQKPPEDAYAWTLNPRHASGPTELTIDFEGGVPVALDGERLGGVELVERLTKIAGSHGIGRIDHLENRLIGIKSREIYEAPAAVVLHAAHAELEKLVLTRSQQRFKATVAQEMADLVYNGLWFSAHNLDLMAYVASTQRFVTGQVRMELDRGHFTATGRQAAFSLYSPSLATYGEGDTFDHTAAVGFIKLFGQQLRTQARVQLGGRSADDVMRLTASPRPIAASSGSEPEA